ncbi:hypothetical protein N431DRAFT_471799 [Stipitochalara longipes BDJ]|nr:hypothetical protein N431DRAFT_471799 [Stipitochalara longipes BDJ]
MSNRTKIQRQIIIDEMLAPPPEERVFGPPAPKVIFWNNAIAQQRYLTLVYGVSDHEKAYSKWHRGNPTSPFWNDLSFLERAEWVQFYFNFNTNRLKVEDIDDEATVAGDQREYSEYLAMFKRKFVPKIEKKEEKEEKRQKVYDVNGTFIGYLNREIEADEKAKSRKNKVIGGVVKKQSSEVAVKQYGPEDAVAKRGPWRPTKHHGPPLADDDMIDPALRTMGMQPPIVRPALRPSMLDPKQQPWKQEYSQFSKPILQSQHSSRLILAPKPKPLELPRTQLEIPYSQWPRPTQPKSLDLPRTRLELPYNTWSRSFNSYSQQSPKIQQQPIQRPQQATQLPRQVPQLPQQSPQVSHQSMVSDDESTIELDYDKVRLGARGYLTSNAPRGHYESPYSGHRYQSLGGSKPKDTQAGSSQYNPSQYNPSQYTPSQYNPSQHHSSQYKSPYDLYNRD